MQTKFTGRVRQEFVSFSNDEYMKYNVTKETMFLAYEYRLQNSVLGLKEQLPNPSMEKTDSR